MEYIHMIATTIITTNVHHNDNICTLSDLWYVVATYLLKMFTLQTMSMT